jgi:uncharacterized membrane protein
MIARDSLRKANLSRWLHLDNLCTYTLFGILGLALTIRLIGLDQGIWLDEYESLRMISKGGLFQTLRALRFDNQTPLYYILLKLWSQIGSSEEFLRLLSVFLGVATVCVVIMLMRRYSHVSTILAGVYFATTPIMLRYSQEIRSYSLLVLATALSFLFASHLTAKPEKLYGYIGLAFSLTVAVSTHLVGVMLIIPICVFIATMALLNQNRIHWHKAALTMAVPCAVFIFSYFFYSVSVHSITRNNWWMPSLCSELILSTTRYLFGFSALSWPPGAMGETTPILANSLEHSITILAFVFIALLIVFGEWRRTVPFIVAAVIYWSQIIIYSIVATPIFWYRTVLPSVVPLVGFVALKTATIRQRGVQIAVIVAFVILSLLSTASWITHEAWKPVEAWRESSKLLASKWQQNDLVIYYPNYAKGPIKYYFCDLPANVVTSVAIGTDIEQLRAEIDNKLSTLDGSGTPPRVFLVIRADLSVQKDQETYYELLSILGSKSRQLSTLQALLITCHDVNIQTDLVDTRNQMLASLESKFGAPLSFQDFDSFVWSTYQIQNQPSPG